MTTALYVAIGWLVLCKIAIAVLAVRAYSYRCLLADLAKLQELTQRELGITSQRATDFAATAVAQLQQMQEERNVLRARMVEIATTIGRRPPRRRWLARARKVAQLAAPVQLV